MSIFIDYKDLNLVRLIELLIQCIDQDQENEQIEEQNDDDSIDYFNLNLFKNLQTPLERMRYFVLYSLESEEVLNDVKEILLDDIMSTLNEDQYVLLKTLLKLVQYDADLVPANFQIYEILKESMINEDLTMDATNLILFYYSQYGMIYSIDDILSLIKYSLEKDDKCRTSIWSLFLRLILLYNYILPRNILAEMIKSFPDYKTIDKYLISQIILAMVLSKNDENKETINYLFVELAGEIKDILFCCAEHENIFTILAIIHSIEKYPIFDFFEELIDYCNEKIKEENINVQISCQD